MPVIEQHLPFLPAELDSHLGCGYYHPSSPPRTRINTEPQTHNLTDDEFIAAVLDAEEAIEAAGHWISPSPIIWGGRNWSGYHRYLSELLAGWLVQRESVKELLPHFWIYAALKVREQPAFQAYIKNVLDDERRTVSLWQLLLRDAKSTMNYYITTQYCPTL